MRAGTSADERVRLQIGRMMPWLPVISVLVRVFGPAINLYARLFMPQRHRYYYLDRRAWRAYVDGRIDDAEALSRELLDLAVRLPRDWNYGNAIHDGNQILGLVALSRGGFEEANVRLLAAGATPGSPQLNSFGPHMVLARELLARGETDVVLAYLELVRAFWAKENCYLTDRPGHHRLKQETEKKIGLWKKEIRGGRIPTGDNWD